MPQVIGDVLLKDMFYTRYRPQKFSEISTPNKSALALMNQVKAGKTVHAYLFVGSRGTGKTTTARILAKALNCSNIQDNGDPCNKCQNCTGISSGAFFDLIEIDAASNRGIDDIRELRNKVKLAPSVGSKKVYIIDEVHMLTAEAFNALLKTLEEPPKHCVFILCTTELHKVPDTIKSRCQVFKFRRATITQLVSKLEKIAKAENADISKDALQRIAQAASGGFRDAETLLQQVVEGNVDVASLLSAVSVEDYADFVDWILKKDVNSAFRYVTKIFGDGLDLYVWVGELLKYLRDLLFVKAEAYEGLIDVTDEMVTKMKAQASFLSYKELIFAIEAFSHAQSLVKSSSIPQLPIELVLIELCAGARDGVTREDSDTDLGDSGADDVGSEGSENTISKGNEEDNSSLDIEGVKESWTDVLDQAVEYNHSIQALLKAGDPINITKNTIILEVAYAFHKERLESPKNRRLVEKIFFEVFEKKLCLKCKVNKQKTRKKRGKETGNLTDYNIASPSASNEEILQGSVIKIFDGNLPLG